MGVAKDPGMDRSALPGQWSVLHGWRLWSKPNGSHDLLTWSKPHPQLTLTQWTQRAVCECVRVFVRLCHAMCLASPCHKDAWNAQAMQKPHPGKSSSQSGDTFNLLASGKPSCWAHALPGSWFHQEYRQLDWAHHLFFGYQQTSRVLSLFGRHVSDTSGALVS